MSGKENGMKTSELTGAALDWAVAKCEGRSEPEVVNNFSVAWYTWGNTHYSTDWAQGGPIIEREGISLACRPKDARGLWCAVLGPNRFLSPDHEGSGPTPLIAAMRCYVASKLGDEVEIPEELK
jgi:hypothetical protein